MEERKRRSWVSTVAISIVVALVAYLIGYGPYLRLVLNNPHDHSKLTAFYKPIWNAARYPVAGHALAVYANLWLAEPLRATYNSKLGFVIFNSNDPTPF